MRGFLGKGFSKAVEKAAIWVCLREDCMAPDMELRCLCMAMSLRRQDRETKVLTLLIGMI